MTNLNPVGSGLFLFFFLVWIRLLGLEGFSGVGGVVRIVWSVLIITEVH